MTTYLQAVNDVLVRLREDQVSTVTENKFSTLIGKFVNDAKRQVEDAWNWDALSTTLTLNTVGGTSTYTLTGSGLRHKQNEVNDTTNKITLQNAPIAWIQRQQQLVPLSAQIPMYYAWNGNDGTDTKVELYPTPSGVNVLKFNMYVPQVDLSADADVITLYPTAIVAGAYARALVERGEDGGLASSEAYSLYRGILSDMIAIESTRFIENEVWSAT